MCIRMEISSIKLKCSKSSNCGYRKKKGERNVKISGTIKPEQDRWIKKMIDKGKFYNISHILQEGIKLLQVKDNGK